MVEFLSVSAAGVTILGEEGWKRNSCQVKGYFLPIFSREEFSRRPLVQRSVRSTAGLPPGASFSSAERHAEPKGDAALRACARDVAHPD
jgi:hypothetical protein